MSKKIHKFALKEKFHIRFDKFCVYFVDPARKFVLNTTRGGKKHKEKTSKNISIVIVNYNTLFLIAHLIYSIFDKIVYSDGKIRIIVVDNASLDGSRDFLEVLEKNDFIRLIGLNSQKYHGPGLRIGIRAIENFERRLHEENRTGTVLTLDTDVIVLREDLISAALEKFCENEDAALLGQLQYNKILGDEGGYPHPSCLFIRKEIYDLPCVRSFVRSGTPAISLVRSVMKNGYEILNFPASSDGYILHLGRGTLGKIRQFGLRDNTHYKWALKSHEPHYHGRTDGEVTYGKEVAKFIDHIKELKHPYDSYIEVLETMKARKNLTLNG
jgi:glycosyltransferase involved in cell wall biosynthesis